MSQNKAYISAPFNDSMTKEQYLDKVFSIRKKLEERGFVFPQFDFYTYRLQFEDLTIKEEPSWATSILIDWTQIGKMPDRLDQFCLFPRSYGLVYFCKGWEDDGYCQEEHGIITHFEIPTEYEQ